ncbi:MAG TPA: SUMF1/EgtB/PvdO family nonheme iron enzyme [Polyangiaceae bacterium]|nr:SUMF1/EgtB/PvdO family nonheme iron enzyme [Polyangiaceae bacterium]
MRTLLWSFRVIVLVLLALVASTCASSESHIGKTKSFLSECSADAPCADPGQTCFCFCTVSCESSDPCITELERLGVSIDPSRISCRPPSCDAPADAPSDATGVCDVSCSSDADCSIFSDEHRCLGGFCRLEQLPSGPGAGNCPPDMTFVPGDGAGSPDDFCLERYEVTAFAYDQCVEQGSCTTTAEGNLHIVDRDDHPINFVTPADAEAYCAFVGRRLPTLVEWQWAAQNGSAADEYPWGTAAPSASDDPARVCALTVTETCAIGSHPAGDNALGIADLCGDVGEIVDNAGSYCSAGGGHTATEAGLAADAPCAEPVEAVSDVGFRCASAP